MAKVKKPPIKIVVIDVLKPHKPSIVEFGQAICRERSVDSVNISVYAIDEKTETVKMTLEGNDIKFEKIGAIIEEYGGVIHSIDKVVVGRKEIIPTPTIFEHTKS